MPDGGELDPSAELLKAAESGDLNTVETFLGDGHVPVDFLQALLTRTSDIRIASLLIELGAKDTMLLAAGRGDFDSVREFIGRGVSVDRLDEKLPYGLLVTAPSR